MSSVKLHLKTELNQGCTQFPATAQVTKCHLPATNLIILDRSSSRILPAGEKLFQSTRGLSQRVCTQAQTGRFREATQQ